MDQQLQEIEIKLLYKDKEKIISSLRPGIKFKKRREIHDIYYGQKKDEMHHSNNLLRIRTITGEKTELTYKGRARDNNNIWHRLELTTEIKSAQILERILINLGLYKISEYKSIKECWEFNDAKVIFAQFVLPTYLEFMEIEAGSEKKIKDITTRLSNTVQEVGEEIFKIFDQKRKLNK